MSKKPAFWIAFVLLSLAGAVFAYRYFPQAFPILQLDISMDRRAALQAARELAEQHDLGPQDFRQAASFAADSRAQTFVELEGGGTEALGRMLSGGLFAVYTWQVRHFAEQDVNETLFRFTPDGAPYGFVETIDEDAPGAQLSTFDARAIAENEAPLAWQIDLSSYDLVEQSQETRPGERIDHTFVYERQDEQIGEGRYRLRLVVSGDRLTEVTHFIRIPEAHTRRYEEMRAANNAIGAASTVAMMLYLVGAVIGLFFLLRRRWVLWRQPVFWGVLLAFLQLLVGLNQWPLLWMHYDTALSTQGFIAQQLAILVGLSLALAVLLTLSFMAAEGLTRRAFPSHPQLWRVWSREAASSHAILGRTVAGYLLVGLWVAYAIGLYFFSSRVLGWWTPSDILVQPDVLATYVPWLTAIASSLQAGFWEESLFRAVPIAGAALIGDRLGNRRAWIVAAFVIQALVFGAGHAAYATQPSYARLVELIIPSIVFGLLYLRLGLLVAIVLHYAYDVVWFSLPLFVSSAPGVWLDRVMVVGLALVPLWVVLGRRLRAERWTDLPVALLNESWKPEALTAAPQPEPSPVPAEGGMRPASVRAILGAGVVGVVVWAATGSWTSDVERFATGRGTVADVAEAALADRGVTLPDDWLTLPRVHADPDPSHRFIWETAGEARYDELLGSYLNTPHWDVRFVTFEGDVAARAEEWIVQVTGRGAPGRMRHLLPESDSGPSLTEFQARELAHAAARDRLGFDPSVLEDVSATSSRLEARTDWVLTFADTTAPALERGERRVEISVAGDEVVRARRLIYVPEEWERQQRSTRASANIFQWLSLVCFAGLFLTGGVVGVIWWSRKNFAVRIFFGTFVILLVSGALELLNSWPATVSDFKTAQPLNLQMWTNGGVTLVVLMIASALFALSCGVAPRWSRGQGHLQRGMAIRLSLALGALGIGAAAVGSLMGSHAAPQWPAFGAANSYLPFAAAALGPIAGYVTATAALMLIFGAADGLTHGWTRQTLLGGVLLVVVGIVLRGAGLAGQGPAIMVATGMVTGLAMLAAYVFVVRFHMTVVPLAVATMVILGQLPESANNAYPGAASGSLLGAVIIAVISWWWFSELRREATADE